MTQLKIPAVYMRGGTSKGVFFRAGDLPADAKARDRILLRAIGSPDPYGKQIDGMGGATSSTSKVVIVSPSKREGCDVEYLFGQVAIDKPLIDWSGNCGNLTAAVGPFALSQGWVAARGTDAVTVRMWQANIGRKIVATVPVREGEVVEEGDFVLDGVTFPSAEIRLEFIEPGGMGEGGEEAGAMFPTRNVVDDLDIPGMGTVQATLITAGNPTVFVDARAMGITGAETAAELEAQGDLLIRCERIRSHAAVAMGLAKSAAEASATRLHTPKIAMVTTPQAYTASNGRKVTARDIDLTIRMVSMGRIHHAITGTGAIATAVASAIPGTIPNAARIDSADAWRTRLGHPSGTLTVGAEVARVEFEWTVKRAMMSRSARRLMEGWVRVPSA